MLFYSEDLKPEGEAPDFTPTQPDFSKCRELGKLVERGWYPRISITAVDEEGNRIGLALKIEKCDEKQLKYWMAQASEALHRHIDLKKQGQNDDGGQQ
jgi:hypothetical protein